MFGLSGEHLLILAAILLIFGPRRLPELGASIGKAVRNFKEGFNAPASSGTIEAHQVQAPRVELPRQEQMTAAATPAPHVQQPQQQQTTV